MGMKQNQIQTAGNAPTQRELAEEYRKQIVGGDAYIQLKRDFARSKGLTSYQMVVPFYDETKNAIVSYGMRNIKIY